MNFKSGNWNYLKSSGLKAVVEHLNADLNLQKTGRCVPDTPTTVVVIWSGNNRFVGVSQCSPNDAYSKAKGREIAAGRALKELTPWLENPLRDADPNDVWECEGQEVRIFGSIPNEVDHLIHDRMMFA